MEIATIGSETSESCGSTSKLVLKLLCSQGRWQIVMELDSSSHLGTTESSMGKTKKEMLNLETKLKEDSSTVIAAAAPLSTCCLNHSCQSRYMRLEMDLLSQRRSWTSYDLVTQQELLSSDGHPGSSWSWVTFCYSPQSLLFCTGSHWSDGCSVESLCLPLFCLRWYGELLSSLPSCAWHGLYSGHCLDYSVSQVWVVWCIWHSP